MGPKPKAELVLLGVLLNGKFYSGCFEMLVGHLARAVYQCEAQRL